jgi:hypothetical protein
MVSDQSTEITKFSMYKKIISLSFLFENDKLFAYVLGYDVADIDNEVYEQMFVEMFHYIKRKALD